MAGGRSHPSIKTGIGSTENTDFPIVSLQIFYQPVNRIESICGFVCISRFFFFDKWPHIDEPAFTHPSAPYILYNHYISFLQKILFITGPEITVYISTVWCTVIRGPFHQDGMFFRLIFWQINRSE